MLKTTSEPTTGLKVTTHTLVYQTECAPQFIDITDRVTELVEESGMDTGIAVVFSKHTTAAICINENEPGHIADLERMLCKMFPEKRPLRPQHRSPDAGRREAKRPRPLPAHVARRQ